MISQILRKRGTASFACALFYACLCVFSISVGLYYTFSAKEISMIELSSEMAVKIANEIPVSISLFFGVITFLVGVFQGLASYTLAFSDKKSLYRFTLCFTVFSLLSCFSKLFIVINAFSIVKSFAYSFVIVALLSDDVKNNFVC